MTNPNLRAGFLTLQVNGDVLDVVGNVDYNTGEPKREKLKGPDRVHGTKEEPQIPFIECEVRIKAGFDIQAFKNTVDATVVLILATGDQIMLEGADYSAEGSGKTDDGSLQCRFEGQTGEYIEA